MYRATVAIVLLSICVAAAQTPAKKKADKPAPTAGVSVAVLDYDASSPGNPNLGTQIADILTARLSVEESLALVERSKLGEVLKEQKLKMVGLVDQTEAAKVGKLVGAKLLVMGKAFVMDKKLFIVTRVVGVETSRVVGSILQVDMNKELSGAIMKLSEDVAGLIRKNAAKLLPKDQALPDPIEEIKKALKGLTKPTVAVRVPESHVSRVVVDPAVETEIKKVLLACGYSVVDLGKNDLADWARDMMKGKDKPWPAALGKADVIVVGEAFSEFAVRTGELVTCIGRAEVNLIDRKTGKVILADRKTRRAIDLAEVIAGKTALQGVGRELGIAIARRLVEYAKKMPRPAPKPDKPASPKASAFRWYYDQEVLCAIPVGESNGPPVGRAEKPPLTTKPARKVVFAAPFDNATAQEQYDPAAAGIADLVAVMLAQQEHVTVVERQRLTALTAEQAKSLKGLTGQKYALAAGKLLKADTVLTGRLFLIQDKLTIHVRALDIASARVLGADQLSCRPVDLPETALQLARNLAKQMRLPLPKIDLKKIDTSPIASLHFAKALGHYYAGNMDAAIMQFMRTIDLDPDYTEALYWSGMCYSKLGQDAHTIIEWRKYLKREPKSKYAKQVKKALAEAVQREKESPVQRLGPASRPATEPGA